MRTVEDESGRRYLLVKESREASRVRDVRTGEERYLRNDRLTDVDGVDALDAAARAVPAPVRRVVTAAHDDRTLGLLVELAARGPLSVRALLDAYDLCESDVHGLLGEFFAAGLIEEATVAGERGVDATAEARTAIDRLRQSADSE